MKKFLVTTTIYPRREAIEKFEEIAQKQDWTLIVVGDIKTPHSEYRNNKCIYLSPDDQIKLDKELSDLIGWNCVQRRNMGLLLAHKMGADICCSFDDDNCPKDYWGQDIHIGQEIAMIEYDTDQDAMDPMGVCKGYGHLWHRGFPLQLVSERSYTKSNVVKKIDVQANFADGNPDVCAVTRMVYNPECYFQDADFPFCSKKFAPFNSQNTIVSRDVLKHYCMIPGISRYDDIAISYYIQALGFTVGYFPATVYQERHPHDLTKDLEGEYWGYSNMLKAIKDMYHDPYAIKKYLPERSWAALRRYEELCS